MKKNQFITRIVFVTLLYGIGIFSAYSQNVAVTDNDTYTANPSAMLDVQSINKGLLVPRLTTPQRLAITSPAAGLMVYDTNLKRFYFYTGSAWQDVSDQGLWVLSGKDITLADTTYNISIGSKKTAGKLSVKGDQNIGVNEPLFSVVNTSGDTVFAVYSEGVRIYVKDEPGKASGNKGGFAVGGFSPSKGITNEFLRVTADSVRIYVDTAQGSKATGNKGGFAVGGYTSTKGILHNKYLSVSDDSVRIYIQEPKFKGSGSKGGFAVGGFTPSKGVANEFLRVTSDSTRVFVKDSTAGFGVASIESGIAESFLDLTTQNYFIGHQSGQLILNTGIYNSVIGYQSAFTMSTGKNNTFLGYKCGYSTTSGYDNCFIGYKSGYANKDGIYNVFIGSEAGTANTTGGHNVFIGLKSGYKNTTAWTNTFIGGFTGYENTTGTQNVFVGTSAGAKNVTGFNNIYIGYASGNQNKGSRNIFIGYQAGYSESNISDRLYIDNSNASAPLLWGDFENDRLVVNGSSVHNGNNRTFFVNGSAGGTGIWWNDSDKRLKKNITTIDNPLQKVMALRGVTFEWKDEQNPEKGLHMGFIAQEAEPIIPEVVSKEGKYYSMQYAAVTALLVEAMKEQQRIIEAQNEKIKMLNNDNQQLKTEMKEIKKTLGISAEVIK